MGPQTVLVLDDDNEVHPDPRLIPFPLANLSSEAQRASAEDPDILYLDISESLQDLTRTDHRPARTLVSPGPEIILNVEDNSASFRSCV